MKIQLKRSSVLNNGSAKQPTAGQMEYGELAVNYNSSDPTIFIKDSNDQIIRLAGSGYDYNDLDNLPVIGDGTITLKVDGTDIGSFTVNQEGDTELDIPATAYDDLVDKPIIIDGAEPGTPSHGDLWVDISQCPPVLQIYVDDTVCPGEGGWQEIEGGGGVKPVEPAPGDVTASPVFDGGTGTQGDPYIITAETVAPAGETETSNQELTITGEVGTPVIFTDLSTRASAGSRFAQPVGVVGADGTWTGRLVYKDEPATTVDSVYTGDLQIGTVYFRWEITQNVSAAEINQPTVVAPPDGAGVGGDISYFPETSAVTAVDDVPGGGSVPAIDYRWFSITYGDNKFIAGGITGGVMYSSDADNWASVATPISSTVNRIAYDGNKFVAVGSSGTTRVAYSDDGISWTAASTPVSSDWQSVTYGNGKFVITGGSNNNAPVLYSSDGVNWQSTNGISAGTWWSVTYGEPNGNPTFVAVCSAGGDRVMYSNDGISWTGVVEMSGGWQSVTYGNGRFVAVANNGTSRAMYSDDGINWTTVPNLTYSFRAVTYGNGKFVAVSLVIPNEVAYSTDGINWDFVPSAVPEQSWYDITYGDNKFVAVTDQGNSSYEYRVMYSYNGTNWSDLTKLTLTNDKAFNSADGTEVTTIDQVFTAGTVVDGKGGTATGVLTEDANPSDPSITLKDVTGTWTNGMSAVSRTEATETAPGADVLEFVGSTPQDDPDGSVETWGNATWQVSTDSAFTTPMEATKLISDPDTNQVLLESERGTIVLEANTEYWVRVKYAGNTPDVESTYSAANHFKTASPQFAGGFSTTLYSGSSYPTITTGIDNTVSSLVWLKCRPNGRNNCLFSPQLGTENYLISNTADSLANNANSIIQFNSDGFDLGEADLFADGNANGNGYVAWNFGAAPGFFDIVTYTGNNTVRTIPHNLGSVPGFIVVKGLDFADQWHCYHKETGATEFLQLNTDTQSLDSDTKWNDTEPTDQVFTVGADSGVNKLNSEHVAYLFADNPDAGIKCGSYTGNGIDSTDNQTIDCGFKPGWVMIKITSSGGAGYDWFILDTSRGDQTMLRANKSDAEFTSGSGPSLTNNGFTVSTGSWSYNKNGEEYIYVAIAESVNTTSFFDTNNEEVTKGFQLEKRFGIDPTEANLKQLGIAELTEQPTGPVVAYVPEGDEYKPIPDLSGELAAATQRIAEADATIATMRTNFEARIAALENPE